MESRIIRQKTVSGILTGFLIAFLSLSSVPFQCFGQGGGLGIMPWRPTRLLTLPEEPNDIKAQQFIETLEYSNNDKDTILDVVFHLKPDAATVFLINYLQRYTKRNTLTDNGWGSAILGLGLVQTAKAKNELLRLWDDYDRRLADGRIKVTPQNMHLSNPPLLIIGDALHFYLGDETVRQWFIDRINEAEHLPHPAEMDYVKLSRLSDRTFLLLYLYRWDIMESVDDEPVVTPFKIGAPYLYSRQSVKNVSRAAEAVINWTEKMQYLAPEITEEQWLRIRKWPYEYRLDSACDYLGKPLALAIWKEYLSKSDKQLSNPHRAWMICLGTFLSAVTLRQDRLWEPTIEEDMLLSDALEYVSQLPGGFMQTRQLGSLFKMSLFAPSDTDNVYIRRIWEMSDMLLDENTRQGIIANANLNLRLRGKDEIIINTR